MRNSLRLLAATLTLAAVVIVPGGGAGADQTNVGAIGCSQTRDIFRGIRDLGIDGFWSYEEDVIDYGGGALYQWSDLSSEYWTYFEEALANNPDTTAIWVEFCIKNPPSEVPTADDIAAGETIVAHVAALVPNAEIYVSAMNGYDGISCFLSGDDGPVLSAALADHLVAQGMALTGPVVGPLDETMVKADDCHANAEGREYQAQQLDAFFYGGDAPAEPPPDDGAIFADIAGSVFKSDIEWLAAAGITSGCNPPAYDLFCPYDDVSRGQMAAFLHRALPDLPEIRPAVDFTDDDGSSFEGDIEWLYSRGIAEGTSATTYDPYAPVTRAQMAAFLTRAFGYVADGGGDLFVDDDNSVFEAEIDRLGTAGITTGCNPPVNDMFCPADPVSRGQMAAFLRRALER